MSNDHNSPASVGNRLVQARRLRDLSQAGLAKLIDLTGSAVQTYESGRSMPPLDRLQAMAGVLDVDLAWLALGRGSPPNGAEGSRTARLRADPSDTEAAVRRYDAVRGTTVPLRETAYFIDPPRRKYERGTPRIVSHFPCSDDSFALVVWERRLDPVCQEGDIVIVDPGRPPQPGALIVIRVADQEPFLALGKYRAAPGGGFQLAATSDDWAPIPLFEPLPLEPGDQLQLLGVVSEISRKQPNW